MTLPGFNAEAGMYRSTAAYVARVSNVAAASLVRPQFRSRVRRKCGPCVNGTRLCFLWGYDCSAVEGVPGSDDLGIPASGGHVRCVPEIFQEWETAC